MRVLLAFDKFKDSLAARDACTFAAAALRDRHPDWVIDSCPLSDGGEGFCEILTTAVQGTLVGSSISGPRENEVQAPIGMVPFDRIPERARAFLPLPPKHSDTAPSVAVLDMASASGLALLEPEDRDPWQTTTVGTGELIRTATELGAVAILLGVGGSATHDLGLGALAALGLEFQTSPGNIVFPPIPARWREISRIGRSIDRKSTR